MEIRDILRQVKACGAQLRVREDKLVLATKGSALPDELKAAIREHKTELVELLTSFEKSQQLSVAPVTAQARGDTAPASFAQQRLWLLDKVQNGSTEYHLPFAARVPHDFDLDRAESVFRALLQRHETLRTVYHSEGSRVRQRVISADQFSIECFDQAPSESTSEQQWSTDIFRTFASRPFDLERDLMLRVGVVRTHQERPMLMVNTHHIASDGWSMATLVSEFTQLYQASVAGNELSLPDLPVSYSDYAIWQHEHLAGRHLEKQQAYWLEALSDLPVLHSLPIKTPVRPSERAARATRHSVAYAADEVRDIKAFCARHDCSWFMAVHAALSWTVSRYSYSDDVVIGVPVANRRDASLEGLVGFFVNNLVLRVDTSNALSLAGYMEQVRKVNLRAQEHQDMPFEKLVELLNPVRSQDYTPLFQLFLSMDNTRADSTGDALSSSAVADRSQQMEPVPPPMGPAKYDLSVQTSQDHMGAELVFDYDEALFASDWIGQFAHDVKQLLIDWAEIASPSEVAPTEAPLASARESGQLLDQHAADRADYECAVSVAELFRRQVSARADAVALIDGDRQWTYSDLDGLSDALAVTLREGDVAPGDIVALHLQRSAMAVVAVLAAMKCGAAYVPVSPELPLARRRSIVQQVAPKRIVMTPASPYEAVDGEPPSLMLEERFLDERCEHPAKDCDPAWSAYQAHAPSFVLFTSGSTGEPKGAVNTQEALINHLLGMNQLYPLRTTDRVLHKTPLTFDISVLEMLWTLTSGATLVVAKADGHYDPEYLHQTILEQSISVVDFVPSMFLELHRMGLFHQSEHLRRVLLGGEEVGIEVARLASELPQISFVSQYGLTETAISVTHWPITCREDRYVPIGRAMPGTSLYVLDRNQQLAPPGARGELYIGGKAVGTGYVANSALTEKSYLADRFDPGVDARMYRTGDLARWLPDGELCYLGREDQQLKIRGLRIEAGEIEQQLLMLRGVQDAAVVTLGEGVARQLAAVVIDTLNAEKNDQEYYTRLKSELRKTLPAYMVPHAIFRVDALPRTANGKLDRKRLSLPSAMPSVAKRSPTTPTERALLSIWEEILGHNDIGIDSDFFIAGGHSLLATRVTTAVQQHLGCELPIATMFEYTILKDLAEKIDSLTDQGVNSIPQISRSAPLPLSPAQGRLWFIDRFEGNSQHYNMPLAVRWRGEMNDEAFSQAITALVARHEVLRTTYTQAGDDAYQTVHAATESVIHRQDLSGLTEDQRKHRLDELLSQAASQPFDLETDPGLRVHVFTLGHRDFAISFVVHHIACDGWSIALLQRDLMSFYASLVNSQPIDLPKLDVQYADYSAWQREFLQSSQASEQRTYWQRHLHGVPEVHSLPLDFPRRVNRTMAAHQLTTVIDGDLAHSIAGITSDNAATSFMFFNCAFSLLLSRLSGCDDIVVGTPIAGRTHHQVENVVGFFANTLVLRNQVDRTQSFVELLKSHKKTAIDAFSHQDVPFETLVDDVRPVRNPEFAPLVQITIAMQSGIGDVGGNAPVIDDVELSPLTASTGSARFEVELSISEHEDGFKCQWKFSRSLFKLGSARRITQRFQVLLQSIVDSPESSAGTLAMLAEDDYLLLDQFNAKRFELEPEVAVHRLFEAQVSANPLAIALKSGDQEVSYGELNRRANQFARYVASNLTPSEQPVVVGVCMDRSIDFLIAAIGILKMGGAYLPLDPAYPDARLTYMIDAAQLPMVVTQEQISSRPGLRKYKRIVVDDAGSEHADHDLDVRVGGDDTAYVIYTSGSTGNPKAVELNHLGAVNLIENSRRDFSITHESRVLQFASVSFDASVFEWMVALSNGATLVVCDADTRESLVGLSELLTTERISHTLLPPSLLASLPFHEHYSFTSLIVGGEAPNLEELRRWADTYTLINAYGPTEATVAATYGAIKNGETLTIGSPLANVSVYLLDDLDQAVSVGSTGRLHIGGLGVAAGYLNQPGLTQQKFRMTSLAELGLSADTGHMRLYDTGDLARWHEDGRLEFLGRMDDQVNIRGFRIETAEISHVLSASPLVEKSAVIAFQAEQQSTQLAAYVVPLNRGSHDKEEEGALVEELRSALALQLPAYMIPACFVLVDALPLSSNGKLDLKALPHPTASQDDVHVSPATSVEARLERIWADTLNQERVGVTADFFAAGGHSLMAMGLVAKINQEFQSAVSLRHLFEFPTIRQLAVHLVSGESAPAGWDPLVKFGQGTDLPPFFLLPGAGLSASSYTNLADALADDYRFCVLEAKGFDVNDTPHYEMDELCDDYVEAVLSEFPEGPYVFAGHSAGGCIAFELALRMRALGHDADVVMIESVITLTDEEQSHTTEHEAIGDLIRQARSLSRTEYTATLSITADLEEKKRYLADLLVHVGALPQGGFEHLLEGLVAVYLAQVSLFQRYEPSGTFDGQVLFVHARSVWNEELLKAAIARLQQVSTERVSVIAVDGGHQTVLNPHHVGSLRDALLSLRPALADTVA